MYNQITHNPTQYRIAWIPVSNSSRIRGTAVEAAAERWLSAHGLRLVMKNFSCKAGEIDLVMRDGEQLVFIEVRFRQADRFGSAAESVTRNKQQKIARAAQYFIAAHTRWSDSTCRFDVLGASQVTVEAEIEWQWLRDAFSGE
jgi:putative endonuclease